MREFEMRQRAERLIRWGKQGMITPGLALSLALAGCGGSDYMAPFPRPERHDAADVFHDGAGTASDTPVYSAPFPDAGRLEGWDGAETDAAPGTDIAPGVDSAPAVDNAPAVVDASNDTVGSDSDESTGG